MTNLVPCAKIPHFLTGGGETGALMPGYDWSDSPLGPPDSWPAALRTAVSLMLGAVQPVSVWWGPDLISLYNDGYLPIGGDRHPAVGAPFAELWAEIWDDFRPIVAATLAGTSQHFSICGLPWPVDRARRPVILLSPTPRFATIMARQPASISPRSDQYYGVGPRSVRSVSGRGAGRLLRGAEGRPAGRLLRLLRRQGGADRGNL